MWFLEFLNLKYTTAMNLSAFTLRNLMMEKTSYFLSIILISLATWTGNTPSLYTKFYQNLHLDCRKLTSNLIGLLPEAWQNIHICSHGNSHLLVSVLGGTFCTSSHGDNLVLKKIKKKDNRCITVVLYYNKNINMCFHITAETLTCIETCPQLLEN